MQCLDHRETCMMYLYINMLYLYSKYHGTDKEQCLNETKKGKYEVVVTTYETYRDNQVSKI